MCSECGGDAGSESPVGFPVAGGLNGRGWRPDVAGGKAEDSTSSDGGLEMSGAWAICCGGQPEQTEESPIVLFSQHVLQSLRLLYV